MRCNLICVCLLFTAIATHAVYAEEEQAIPSQEQWRTSEVLVDDPIGLGERLALIDYFQQQKVKLEPGMRLQDLRVLYWSARAQEAQRVALYKELREVYKLTRISEDMSYEALLLEEKDALRQAQIKKEQERALAFTDAPRSTQSSPTNSDTQSDEPAQGAADAAASAWPPVFGKAMPNIQLTDLRGNRVSLHSVSRGKPMFIEYIGMTCGGCNAFLGGNKPGIGPFKGQYAQKDLQSIAEYLPLYGKGVQLSDNRFTHVVVFFYGLDGKSAPSLRDAQHYAKHYQLGEQANQVVLFGDQSFINGQTMAMIPGFQLVDDKKSVVSHSVGHNPLHNLYTHTMPALADLIK